MAAKAKKPALAAKFREIAVTLDGLADQLDAAGNAPAPTEEC